MAHFKALLLASVALTVSGQYAAPGSGGFNNGFSSNGFTATTNNFGGRAAGSAQSFSTTGGCQFNCGNEGSFSGSGGFGASINNGFSSGSTGFSSGSTGFSSGARTTNFGSSTSSNFGGNSGSSFSSNSGSTGSFGGSTRIVNSGTSSGSSNFRGTSSSNIGGSSSGNFGASSSSNFGGSSSSSFGGSSSGNRGGSSFNRGSSNQGRGGANAGIDFSQGTRRPDGKICVTKEETVETLAKDPVLECNHKNVEKCHYTYKTQFNPAQEEVCEENFEKKCQITFKKQAVRETVKKCYKPQIKVCNGQGPEECRTVYESSCTTRYIEKQPGKFVGDTACEKLPIEICGAGCVNEEGPEECHDKEVDSLVDVPEEVCDLNPQKTCRFQTKLVPSLKPEHECTIIPQETCNLRFTSPRRETKPLRSEWCLDDSPPVPDETYDERNAQGAALGRR